MTRSRLVVPLAAALAVLAVLAGIWWVTSGSDDPDEASPAAGGGADPSAGSGSLPSITPAPVPDPPTPTSDHAVAVDGYFPRTTTVLALNYAIGVPECYGELTTPHVEETDDAVVVTLQRTEPKQREGVSCIDIALMKSVDISLDTPLGDRRVLDGGHDDKPVDKADAPYENSTM